MEGFTEEAMMRITDRFLEMDENCQLGSVQYIAEENPELADYLYIVMMYANKDKTLTEVMS